MQDYYQQKVFGNNYPNIVVLLSFTGTICLICTNCTSLGQILASYVGGHMGHDHWFPLDDFRLDLCKLLY